MKKISWITAVALVVSNMIGTGVFTSLGYQVEGLSNTITIMLLWSLGGVLALFGAFCYAELGNYYQKTGGDYIYLSRAFHPVLGYLSSFVSLIVGFSAPVSLAALAMCEYLEIFGWNLGKEFAIGTIIIIAIFQSINLNVSSAFQNIFTLIKVIFIIALIILGLSITPSEAIILDTSNGFLKEIQLPVFASSLIFVTFAYVGWNSASYIVGEIKEPSKNLPKSLLLGVVFVTIAYILLNFVFLKHASNPSLVNQEDVATIATQNFLGITGAKWAAFFIALQLVATISGYIWIGSRVTQATAKEYKLWRILDTPTQTPYRAIIIQAVISIIIIMVGVFEEIFVYASFLLQIFSVLGVVTVFTITSSKRTIIKKNYFYILPVVFTLFSIYICYYTFNEYTTQSLLGLLTLVIGLILYGFDRKI